jgi:NAD(P)-dependent dehydrogenase (short-subunit alcohol dehydrogenase family)
MHPSIARDHVAVITGAASGLGRAAALYLAQRGMRVVLVDMDAKGLAAVQAEAAGSVAEVVDVADRAQVTALADRVYETFGVVHLVMNNAGIQPGSTIFDEAGVWERILGVNLMGVVHGAQVFAPRMMAGGQPGLVINTGSKQGITTPPGDPAYNISKSGVKVFTEALQHHLRKVDGCRVEAKLFIPGFVFTALTAHGRTERPAGAWTPEQTVEFLFDSVARGDFYILCPDNEVDRRIDAKRILWAAGDIAENRPPLSRWHGGFDAEFAEWLRS